MAVPFHGNTLNQLAIAKQKPFVEQVDNLTENAPIVKQIPFTQSSDQLWDVTSELRLVSSVGRVDLNAPLPGIQIADAMQQSQLNIFGAQSFVPEDTATLEGGPAKYFAKSRKSFERQTGMDMEKSYLYNAFLPFALAMNKAGHGNVQDAGGTANANYSIIVVRFDELNMTGLFSPLAFKRDTFLEMKALNNGALYTNPDPNNKFYLVNGYGMQMKTFVGVRMLSWRNIGAIVNIDITQPTPLTIMMMNKALLAARSGEAGRTVILCHPMVKLYLQDIGKIQFMQTNFGDKAVNWEFETWNGIQIITSYNFMDGTETNISL